MLRTGDAKTSDERKGRDGGEFLRSVFEIGGFGSRTGQASAGQDIQELSCLPRDQRRSVQAGVGGDQTRERHVELVGTRCQRCDRVEIPIRNDDAVEPGGGQAIEKMRPLETIDDRDAHHREKRDLDRVPDGRHLVERALDRGPSSERAMHGGGDDGAVCDGVAERNPDFDGIRSRLLKGIERRGQATGVGIPRHDEWHEGTTIGLPTLVESLLESAHAGMVAAHTVNAGSIRTCGPRSNEVHQTPLADR